MHIFITGENGYVSNSLEKYIYSKVSNIQITKKSIRNNDFNQLDLSNVDVIVHTAAIVHKKEKNFSEEEYDLVNAELTRELALRAKKMGVKHFVFLSTMAIFGLETGCINEKTSLNPKTLYGKSKLKAENYLKELETDNFIISIIRPPMIYGPKCPGNYKALSKISKMIPLFPKVKNKRSMIYIFNLTELIYQIIKNEDSGIFHPQDIEFIVTSDMVKQIGIVNNKKILISSLLGKISTLLLRHNKLYKKIFGDLYYSESFSMYRDNSYQITSIEQAIIESEKEQMYEKNI